MQRPENPKYRFELRILDYRRPFYRSGLYDTMSGAVQAAIDMARDYQTSDTVHEHVEFEVYQLGMEWEASKTGIVSYTETMRMHAEQIRKEVA